VSVRTTLGAEQVGRSYREGFPVDARAYPVMADTHVEDSGPAGANRKPSATVVAPTRNAARTLAACLASLRSQTYSGHRRICQKRRTWSVPIPSFTRSGYRVPRIAFGNSGYQLFLARSQPAKGEMITVVDIAAVLLATGQAGA